MARIFYVHWNQEQRRETVRALRAKGHTVVFHYRTEEGAGARAWQMIRSKARNAIIVSLARLPSHGRRVAAVTTQYKALREVPVIFVDGEKERVDMARREFPHARFCKSSTLDKILAGD